MTNTNTLQEKLEAKARREYDQNVDRARENYYKALSAGGIGSVHSSIVKIEHKTTGGEVLRVDYAPIHIITLIEDAMFERVKGGLYKRYIDEFIHKVEEAVEMVHDLESRS